jgi:hypothetical protein
VFLPERDLYKRWEGRQDWHQLRTLAHSSSNISNSFPHYCFWVSAREVGEVGDVGDVGEVGDVLVVEGVEVGGLGCSKVLEVFGDGWEEREEVWGEEEPELDIREREVSNKVSHFIFNSTTCQKKLPTEGGEREGGEGGRREAYHWLSGQWCVQKHQRVCLLSSLKIPTSPLFEMEVRGGEIEEGK